MPFRPGSALALDPARDYVCDGDNLVVLGHMPSESVQMIYIDPPFNTGRTQRRTTLRTAVDPNGDRGGFKGLRYTTTPVASSSYADDHPDYLGFLRPRLEEARRVLARTGTIYVHLDYREVHYVKVLMDGIFSRACFLNEIIWAYDYGARSTSRWPAKHDTILVYVKDAGAYYFDAAEVDREPYMAPGLVSPEKARRGKLPTDVWWHTIVTTTGREKTGYPTQKPEGIVRRMVLASSRPGDRVVDFFAGSGTLGAVAAAAGRRFLLVDTSPDACAVMAQRLSGDNVDFLRVEAAEEQPPDPAGGRSDPVDPQLRLADRPASGV
jgi:site-specific DNA-methyltransferase (adenine-specific)